MAYTSSPPGRRSIWWALTANPSAAHQDSIPSLVVQSSHTSSIGAAKVRSSVTRRRASCVFGAKLGAPIRLIEGGNVQLLHLEHCFHGFRGVAVCRVAQHLAQSTGNDLPRQAEPILQPAAGAFLSAAGRQRCPQPVDLFLRLAGHYQRDPLGERESRPTVKRGVLTSVE